MIIVKEPKAKGLTAEAPLVCAIPDPKLFAAHYRMAAGTAPNVFMTAHTVMQDMRTALGDEVTRLQSYLKTHERDWTFNTTPGETTPVTSHFLKHIERNIYAVLPYISLTADAIASVRDGRAIITRNEQYLLQRRQAELSVGDLDLLEAYNDAFQKAKREFGVFANLIEGYMKKLPLDRVVTILRTHVEAAILVGQSYVMAKETAEIKRLRTILETKRARTFPVDLQASKLLDLIKPMTNGNTPTFQQITWPTSDDLLSPPVLQ
jgi:hypothetical protein